MHFDTQHGGVTLRNKCQLNKAIYVRTCLARVDVIRVLLDHVKVTQVTRVIRTSIGLSAVSLRDTCQRLIVEQDILGQRGVGQLTALVERCVVFEPVCPVRVQHELLPRDASCGIVHEQAREQISSEWREEVAPLLGLKELFVRQCGLELFERGRGLEQRSARQCAEQYHSERPQVWKEEGW